MLKDLIELQKGLEKERKFVPIYSRYRDDIAFADEEKTLSEIASEEDTEGLIEKCEELMKNIIIFLDDNDLSCSSITISSEVGFFVNKNLSEKMKNEMKKTYSNGKDMFREAHAGNTLAKYVPLEFGIKWGGCYLSEEYVPSTVKTGKLSLNVLAESENEFVKAAKSINKLKVSGIVDLEKFISILNDMGYTVEDCKQREIKNFVEYIDSYFDSVGDTQFMNITIGIKADLRKQEENNKVAVK